MSYPVISICFGSFLMVLVVFLKIIALKKEHDLFKTRAIEWWFLPRLKHLEGMVTDLFNQSDFLEKEDKESLMQKINQIYCHNISDKKMADLESSLREIEDAYDRLRFN